MTYQRWIIIVLSFMIFPMLSLALLNYVIDPFTVFHSHFLKQDYELNDRFNKVKAIEKNHHRYNAYMFGSSRSGTTPPSIIEKYIPNSRFYNFFMAGCNQYDNEIILRYLIKQKYDVKHIYLQIDMSDLYGYAAPAENYHAKHHPHATDSSMTAFYLSYLTILPVERFINKLKMNYLDHKPRVLKCDIDNTGCWYVDHLDQQIQKDPKAYIDNEPSFHPTHLQRASKGTKIKENIAALKKFKQLVDEQGIHLIVYIAPHNHNMMNTFHRDSYLAYLAQIAQIVPYWDFSGYNSVTMDNQYYYESSHYRRELGELVAKRIFGDLSYPAPPSDFGHWVSQKNILTHLAQRNQEIDRYEQVFLAKT